MDLLLVKVMRPEMVMTQPVEQTADQGGQTRAGREDAADAGETAQATVLTVGCHSDSTREPLSVRLLVSKQASFTYGNIQS